jgi:hypothetical protein
VAARAASERELTPTVPKTLSQVALRRLMRRYPEKLESWRGDQCAAERALSVVDTQRLPARPAPLRAWFTTVGR